MNIKKKILISTCVGIAITILLWLDNLIEYGYLNEYGIHGIIGFILICIITFILGFLISFVLLSKFKKGGKNNEKNS